MIIVKTLNQQDLKLYKNNGYIAKLNKSKDEIINVYRTRKDASIIEQFDSVAFLDNYVKNGNIVMNKYYYVLYESCSKELKTNFLKKINKTEIILSETLVGKFKDNLLIQEYKSKYDCFSNNVFGQKVFNKILDNNIEYDGHTYKTLPKQLFY